MKLRMGQNKRWGYHPPLLFWNIQVLKSIKSSLARMVLMNCVVKLAIVQMLSLLDIYSCQTKKWKINRWHNLYQYQLFLGWKITKMSVIFTLSHPFQSLLKICRGVPTQLVIRDREHATSMAALGRAEIILKSFSFNHPTNSLLKTWNIYLFICLVTNLFNSVLCSPASFSAMAALTLHLQAEDVLYSPCQNNSVSQVEVEVGVRERSRALVMTVDHNNFLPCLSVSEAATGCSRIDYRPV